MNRVSSEFFVFQTCTLFRFGESVRLLENLLKGIFHRQFSSPFVQVIYIKAVPLNDGDSQCIPKLLFGPAILRPFQFAQDNVLR